MAFNLTTTINALIACSAILGNGLVIFVMTVRRKQFSSFTNRLIRHQSIIDFVSGWVFLALKVLKATPPVSQVGETFFGGVLCRFVHSDYFVWAVNVASTYNLVVISLERFLATCYPIKHRNYCSLFKIKVSMCAAWIIGFTYALNSVFIFRVVDGYCIFTHFDEVLTDVTIASVALLTEYLIPLFAMSFAYTRIVLSLKQKLTDNRQQRDGIISKAKTNVIVTMLILGVFFVVCWTPLEVLKLKTIITNDFRPLSLYVVVTGLLTCNMCVNPVVYCFKYKHFRKQLVQLIRSTRVRPGEESTDEPTLSIDPIMQNTAVTETT